MEYGLTPRLLVELELIAVYIVACVVQYVQLHGAQAHVVPRAVLLTPRLTALQHDAMGLLPAIVLLLATAARSPGSVRLMRHRRQGHSICRPVSLLRRYCNLGPAVMDPPARPCRPTSSEWHVLQGMLAAVCHSRDAHPVPLLQRGPERCPRPPFPPGTPKC